jgi:hypothetical protein
MAEQPPKQPVQQNQTNTNPKHRFSSSFNNAKNHCVNKPATSTRLPEHIKTALNNQLKLSYYGRQHFGQQCTLDVVNVFYGEIQNAPLHAAQNAEPDPASYHSRRSSAHP